jgi:hypothetical protein
VSALRAIFLGFALVACGSTGGGSAPGTFSGDPVADVMSESGSVHMTARTSPNPIERGEVALQVKAMDTKGVALDGVTMSAVPWMPAMGHGTSVVPTVTPKGNGIYELTNVNLFMPGHWEVRITMSGAVTDKSTFAFDVP